MLPGAYEMSVQADKVQGAAAPRARARMAEVTSRISLEPRREGPAWVRHWRRAYGLSPASSQRPAVMVRERGCQTPRTMLRTFRSRWVESDHAIMHPTASNEEAKMLFSEFEIQKVSTSTPAGDGAAGSLTGVAIERPLVPGSEDRVAEVHKTQNCLQSYLQVR